MPRRLRDLQQGVFTLQLKLYDAQLGILVEQEKNLKMKLDVLKEEAAGEFKDVC